MAGENQLFWGRTLRLIKDIWPIGDAKELRDRVGPDLQEGDLAAIQEAIHGCLEGVGGEVSARSRAAELGRAYIELSGEGRRRFLELLATEYDVDNLAVEKAIEERLSITVPADLQEANHRLRDLLRPPRTVLLSRFNELESGVKFLVDMREDLLPLTKENPALKSLDRDLHQLLASWFDIGFLELRRITWESPAAVLEKLIRYEAVHAISCWSDLKNRLRDDRRCYGFFHPSMPDEPLIFVEIALVNGLAENVGELLDLNAPVGDPEKADTAIFYSISNCQKGLAGVSFGNFLIKRVVADLALKLPGLKTFSTLSPIPGFMKWLTSGISGEELGLNEKERTLIEDLSTEQDPGRYLSQVFNGGLDTGSAELRDQAEWKETLMSLCARYLLEAKRGNGAYDRVAHFHLSNGAQVGRINWGGNTTEAGYAQSASIMVNYIYNLSQIERNHELYSGKGEIATSSSVRKLIRK